MKIKLTFDVFGVRLGGFSIDFDLGEPDPAPPVAAAVSKPVKWISKKWLKGMTS